MIESTQQNARFFDCLSVVENDVVIGSSSCLIRAVEENYKETPIGIIPVEWGVKKLKDIVLNKKGSIKIGPFGSQLKLSDMSNDGIKVYGQENVIKKDLKLGKRYISFKKYDTLKSCTIHPGDLVVTMMGTIGKCMIFPNTFEKGIMDSHLIRVQLDPLIVHTPYFAHIFESYKKMHDQLNRLSQGGIMSGLSSSIIKELYIPLPSILEQHKIATIFSSVDAAIEHTDAIIGQTNRMKNGLMKDLFTKGINHEKFKESQIGRIPNEWEAVRIEDLINRKIISEVQDGNHGELHPKEGDFQNEGIPFITANCLNHGHINFDNAKFLDRSWLKKLRIGFAKPGDILLTHKGTIGQTNVLGNEYNTVILSPQVTYYRISDTSSLVPEYLHVVFQSLNFQNKIKQLSMQSTRAYLSITQQKSIFVPFPSPIEQQKISVIILTIDGKLENEREHGAYLLKLKSGLMQNLLTGRVRVKVDGHA